MHKIAFTAVSTALVALAAASCSSIDCPLNSRVMATCKFGDAGEMLTDTLTVSTTRYDGNDSVLVNRAIGVDSITVPMSYTRDADVFYLDFAATGATSHVIDTLTVSKTNVPHFESVDCNPMTFHTITDVKCTAHRVESVTINNDYVTYEASKAHLIIRLRNSQ